MQDGGRGQDRARETGLGTGAGTGHGSRVPYVSALPLTSFWAYLPAPSPGRSKSVLGAGGCAVGRRSGFIVRMADKGRS